MLVSIDTTSFISIKKLIYIGDWKKQSFYIFHAKQKINLFKVYTEVEFILKLDDFARDIYFVFLSLIRRID